jgi:hypothetical protein
MHRFRLDHHASIGRDVAPDAAGSLPLGPTPKRLEADPTPLSTEHATLPPTASDAVRGATDRISTWIWLLRRLRARTVMDPEDIHAPVTFAFLIERRPTDSNIPVSSPLSTLRSPAVMHKIAGQKAVRIPL